MNNRLKKAISILTVSGMITSSAALLCGCQSAIKLDGHSLKNILSNPQVQNITKIDEEMEKDKFLKKEMEDAMTLEKAMEIDTLLDDKSAQLDNLPIIKESLTKEQKKYAEIVKNGEEISTTALMNAIKGAVADELDVSIDEVKIDSRHKDEGSTIDIIVNGKRYGIKTNQLFQSKDVEVLDNAVNHLYNTQENKSNDVRKTLEHTKRVLLAGASITGNKLTVQNYNSTINNEILAKKKKK